MCIHSLSSMMNALQTCHHGHIEISSVPGSDSIYTLWLTIFLMVQPLSTTQDTDSEQLAQHVHFSMSILHLYQNPCCALHPQHSNCTYPATTGQQHMIRVQIGNFWRQGCCDARGEAVPIRLTLTRRPGVLQEHMRVLVLQHLRAA